MSTQRMSLGKTEEKKEDCKALEELLNRLVEYGSRPNELIAKLVKAYPQFVEDGIGYHGFVSNHEDIKTALEYYNGYASFSESLMIASRFAVQHDVNNFKVRAVIKQKGKFFKLYKFIEDVRRRYPNLEFFEDYCSELEMYAIPKDYEVVEEGELPELTELVETKVWYGLSYYMMYGKKDLLDVSALKDAFIKILEYDVLGLEKPHALRLALYETFRVHKKYWDNVNVYHGFNGMLSSEDYLSKYKGIVSFTQDLGIATRFAGVVEEKDIYSERTTNMVLRTNAYGFMFHRFLKDVRELDLATKINFLIDRFIVEEEVLVLWEDLDKDEIDCMNWQELNGVHDIDIIRDVLENPEVDSMKSAYLEYRIYSWCSRKYSERVRDFMKCLLDYGINFRPDLRYQEEIYSGIVLKNWNRRVYQARDEVASFSCQKEQALKFMDDEYKDSINKKEEIHGCYLGIVHKPVAFNLSLLMCERSEFSKNYGMTDAFDGYGVEEEKLYYKVYDEVENYAECYGV